MNNLEAFNLIAARVFAGCYAVFPLGADFHADEIPLDVDKEEKVKLFVCTMQWLVRYGWITTSGRALSPSFWGVQLTEKAFTALGWLPETLWSQKRPLGERIASAVAKGSLAEMGRLVVEAFKATM